MDPEIPVAPPGEARLIRTAREAAGMTAAQAAQATEGAVSATYWRDVERGHGGRRGQQAPTRASARLLAAMARVTGVTPDQLADARREDAARVLAEILRREGAARPAAVATFPVPGAPPVAEGPQSAAILADLLERYPDDDVIQAIAAQGARRAQPTWSVVQDILHRLEEWEHDEAPAREILAGLLATHPDVEVIQVIGRQRGKKASMVTAEILEWLDWRPPETEARNGTAG